jgi:hypothetical protein
VTFATCGASVVPVVVVVVGGLTTVAVFDSQLGS